MREGSICFCIQKHLEPFLLSTFDRYIFIYREDRHVVHFNISFLYFIA